jgi:hypothetical protein
VKRNATFPTPAIAPLDLTPTGHLPAIVAQAALTPAQADGLACIHCGREDGPMAPAGTVNGTQVFRCSPACPTEDTAREHPAGLLTVAQQTLVYDEGMPAHRTTPIESTLRDLDATQQWGDPSALPWLSAEVVILAEEPGYGRKTEVWTSYGVHTAELTPAQGREALAAMREFADRYEALLDFADQAAAADHEARG